jgi:hypothetical protein
MNFARKLPAQVLSSDRLVPAPKDGLVLRSELCGGPRPVAHARMTLRGGDPTVANVAQGIDHLTSDLVACLAPSGADVATEFLELAPFFQERSLCVRS